MPTKIQFRQLSNRWSIGAGLGVVAVAVAGVVSLFSGEDASGNRTFDHLSDGTTWQAGTLTVGSGSETTLVVDPDDRSVEILGSLSGETLSGFGLVPCDEAQDKLLWYGGQFECGTDLDMPWSGTGALKDAFDQRYVQVQGGTMTGALVIDPDSDTTAMIRVNDADGGSPVFLVDSTNEYVGIATASPVVPLHVEGRTFISAATASDTFIVRNTNTNGDIILADAGSSLPRFVVQGGGNVGIGTASPNALLQVGTGTPTNAASGIQFGDDNQAYIYRNAANQVRIGSNVIVNNNLTVGNQLTAGQFLDSTGKGVRINSNVVSLQAASNQPMIQGEFNQDTVISPTRTTTTDGQGDVGINAGGVRVITVTNNVPFVGIGTASPSEKLHVYSDAASNTLLRIENANASTQWAGFILKNNLTQWQIINDGGGNFTWTLPATGGAEITVQADGASFNNTEMRVGGRLFMRGQDSEYSFDSNGNNGLAFVTTNTIALQTAGSSRLIIDPSGDVGIGTDASPTTKLEVVGTMSGQQLTISGLNAPVGSVPCFKAGGVIGYRLVSATGTLLPTCN